MQKILRNSFDIVLFTTDRYLTCFEAVNLEQTLIVQCLNGTSTTHTFAGLNLLVKSCSAGLGLRSLKTKKLITR